MKSSDPITRLVNAFAKLPGIGERTATRLAFFVLNQPEELAHELAESLVEVKEKVGLCERCCNLTDDALCSICKSTRRDHSTICVVASTQDLRAIDNTGEFQGAYHVLHGVISPLEGIGPDDIHVRELLQRLESPEANGGEEVDEIIVATSPSVDGEATSLYLKKLIAPLDIRISRIASGVPIGSELEYTDKSTLSRALSQRREF
ncbi:MAG: recombination mediator RecR [Myxococcota bacterium]